MTTLPVSAPRGLFHFPNPVNEYAARTVAASVVVLTLATILTGQYWFSAVLFLGFLLRVASGPRFSPLGQLATKVVAPRLGPAKLVPGPPKRFAQAIGAAVTGAATVVWFSTGSAVASGILLGVLVVAASLEAFAGFCLGCWIFGKLMAIGVIPRSVCESCADVSRRYA